MTGLAGVAAVAFGSVWQYGGWPSVVDTGTEQWAVIVVYTLGGLLIGAEILRTARS
jgi:hypothetical protein